MKHPNLMLCLLCLTLTATTSGQEIFRCLDKNGKVAFTDDKKNCHTPNKSSDSAVESVEIEITNLHSRYGQQISEEYHNYAFRAYEDLSGYSIRVIAEKKLVETDASTLEQAAKKLEKAATTAINAFPLHTQRRLQGVKYYIFSGDEALSGGRRGGQWYFREGNRTSARFDDSIVIRSASNYLRYSDERAAQTAAHELSHAYYDYHRKRLYRAVKNAFLEAKKNKLYLNVEQKNGPNLKEAYAMSNHREYFAELSKIYNLNNYYYPYNAQDLKHYDPQGYQVIREAFSASPSLNQ